MIHSEHKQSYFKAAPGMKQPAGETISTHGKDRNRKNTLIGKEK